MSKNKLKKSRFFIAASSIIFLGASFDLAANPQEPFPNGQGIRRAATFSVELTIKESCDITIDVQDDGASARIDTSTSNKKDRIAAGVKISCSIEKTAGLIQFERNSGGGGKRPFLGQAEPSRGYREAVSGNDRRELKDGDCPSEIFAIIYF